MFNIILGFLLDAVIASVSWLAQAVRSAFGHFLIDIAARGGREATTNVTPSRQDQRRIRKHLKHLAHSGEIEELIRACRQLDRDSENVALRIDAIKLLTAADPVAAEPVLRESIIGCDDAWLVLAALDRAARYRMTGLLDCVEQARDDHRPSVAKLAADVHRRLVKADRKRSEGATR